MSNRIFNCSNCNKPLAEVIVVKPEADKFHRMRAECPYGCLRSDGKRETSFVQDIKGLIHVKGWDKDNPEMTDGKQPTTNLLGFREDGDIVTIITETVRGY